MADANLMATVLVCVKGDRRVLRLVESLLRQTSPADRYEVIVVENGSSALDGIAKLDPARVRYLHTHEPNAAAARNLGLAAARGRFLLLTDADCVADPEWVERLSERLASGSHGAVGGAIRKHHPQTLTQRYGITVVDGQQSLNYLPALPRPYVVGANAGYPTALVRELGGFDEELKSGHDVDICYRLGLHGHRIGLAPDAIVFHEDRWAVGDHFRRFRHYAIYQVLLHAKYKTISGKAFVVNPYPFRRVASALAATPRAVLHLLSGDAGPAVEAFLKLVEAAGVWSGDLVGSIRYRQLYL
jgi:glycosyltransferase involved in cell wall biosynthesis